MNRARRAGLWLVHHSDRVIAGALLTAALALPWYKQQTLAAAVLGEHPTRPLTVVAILCVALALVAHSLWRRAFVWLDPAELTWCDVGRIRDRRIGRRLWVGWLGRCVVVVYLVAAGGQVFGWSSVRLPVAAAVFVAVAVLAVTAARRTVGPVARWVEPVVAVALALLGAVLAVLPVPLAVDVRVLWLAAGLAAAAAVGCAVTGGPPGRPRVATGARRAELVSAATERMVRRVSVRFLDLLALLPGPSGRPWQSLFDGPGVALRFAVSGAVSRAGSLNLWALVAVGAAVLHSVLPRVDPLWCFGLGAYLAVLPFAAPLSQLCRQPGLRRWLGCGDRQLRIATAAVVLVPALTWCGLVALLGVTVTWSLLPVVVVVAGSVVRTVTRPAVDFDNLGVVTTPDGNLIPFGLIMQLARGPEVLLIGLALITTSASSPVGTIIAVALAVIAAVGTQT